MPIVVGSAKGLPVSATVPEASDPMFWRDEALPFIEARAVEDGRKVRYARHWHETFSIGLISRGPMQLSERRHSHGGLRG